MRTNCRDVYAVGDIASFPLHAKEENETRKLVNIGHWQMALHHGRTAGNNDGFKLLLKVCFSRFSPQLLLFWDDRNQSTKQLFHFFGLLCLGKAYVTVATHHSLMML